MRSNKYEMATVDEHGIECKGTFKKKDFVKFMKEKCTEKNCN